LEWSLVFASMNYIGTPVGRMPSLASSHPFSGGDSLSGYFRQQGERRLYDNTAIKQFWT